MSDTDTAQDGAQDAENPTAGATSPPDPKSPPGDALDGQNDARGADDGGQDDDDGGDIARARAQAARYRTRLREAESERDGLRDQLDAQRKQVIESAAAAAEVQPELLASAGIEHADLLGDDGAVDPGKLSDAIESVRQKYGLPRRPRVTKHQGQRDGGGPAPSKGLAGAFDPANLR